MDDINSISAVLSFVRGRWTAFVHELPTTHIYVWQTLLECINFAFDLCAVCGEMLRTLGTGTEIS